MDGFEQIVGQLFEEEGYWVHHSVKIDLTKEEKVAIGKPSAPRPEIDLGVLCLRTNTLFLVEVKSYIDSNGVKADELCKDVDSQEGRYKLLTCKSYRDVLANRLTIDWRASGRINEQTKVEFGLAAAKVYQRAEQVIAQHFSAKGWLFWGPTTIRAKMRSLATKGYENNAVTMAAKLLLRD